MFENWKYRKIVEIDSYTDLTNYQIKVELNVSNFDFSKAKSDGSDIRFCDIDKTTKFPYWIEEWDFNNKKALIWVKVPEIKAGKNKIYMYFGNQDAVSESNGDATFAFFDDFLGDEIDTNKWNILEGSPYILNGSLAMPNSCRVAIKESFDDDFIIRVRYDNSEGDHDFRFDIFANSCTVCDKYVEFLIPWQGGDSRADRKENCQFKEHYYTGGPYIHSDDLIADIYNIYSQNKTKVIINQQTVIPEISVDKFGGYIQITKDDDDTNYIKYIYLRKYTEYEPSVYVKDQPVGKRFGWRTKLPGKGYKACIYTSGISRVGTKLAIRKPAKVYQDANSTIEIDTPPQVQSDSNGNIEFYVDTNDYDLDQTFDIDIYKPNGEFYISLKRVNVYNIDISQSNISNYFEADEDISIGDVVVILTNGKVRRYDKSQRDIGVDFEICPGENVNSPAVCFLNKNKLLAGYYKVDSGIYLRVIVLKSFYEEPDRKAEYLLEACSPTGGSILNLRLIRCDENNVFAIYRVDNSDNIHVKALRIYDDATITVADETEFSGTYFGSFKLKSDYIVIIYNNNYFRLIKRNSDGSLTVGDPIHVPTEDPNHAGYKGYIRSGFYDSEYMFLATAEGNFSNNLGIHVYEVDFDNLTANQIDEDIFYTHHGQSPYITGVKESGNKTKMYSVFFDGNYQKFYIRTILYLDNQFVYPGDKKLVDLKRNYPIHVYLTKNGIYYQRKESSDYSKFAVKVVDYKEDNEIYEVGECYYTQSVYKPDGWDADTLEKLTAVSYSYKIDEDNYTSRIVTVMERDYPVIGIALENALAGNYVKVATSGNVDVFNNLKRGRIYYVDTKGNLTLEETEVKIGVALDDKTITLQIYQE
ncbi:MAG: hypothetical protein DRP42_04005 [Tenericutes bacterium]|nr:MAG: hypothetical protein DRP42_04005 [Mycoplasmatota bacterium]